MRISEARCLSCGEEISAATEIDDGQEPERAPQEDDIAICLACGHVMIFADGQGNVRAPTDEELLEIAGDARIVAFNNARQI